MEPVVERMGKGPFTNRTFRHKVIVQGTKLLARTRVPFLKLTKWNSSSAEFGDGYAADDEVESVADILVE